MGAQKITSKQYFRIAKTIHMALLGGIIIFGLVVFLQIQDKELIYGYDQESAPFYIAVGLLGLWALFGGEFIFRSQLKKAKMEPALAQKMMQYQSANIIKYALIEGVALFSIVATLLTLSVWFLVITGFLVLVLLLHYPSIEKACRELDLNIEEQKHVKTPDAYISESYDNRN